MILPSWFDRVEESSSSVKEFQFKQFSPPLKTCCLPDENANEVSDFGQTKCIDPWGELQ